MTYATYDGIPVDSRPLGEALPWERTYPSAPPRSALPEAFIYTRVCVSSPDLQRLHCSVSSRLFRHPISVRTGTKGLRAKRAFWCMRSERGFSVGLNHAIGANGGSVSNPDYLDESLRALCVLTKYADAI